VFITSVLKCRPVIVPGFMHNECIFCKKCESCYPRIFGEKRWPIKKKELERLYLKEFKTLDEIAEHFGVTKTKIRYWKTKHGIKNLEPWERSGIRKFTKEQKEYLYGALLGDDSLRRDRTGYPHLSVAHSSKQRDYVVWKYKLWKQLAPGNIKSTVPIKVRGKTYFSDRFITKRHPEFDKFYELFYGNGKKRVTKDILNKLTPFSIAIWYMDDGCYVKRRGRAVLATNSFTHKENLIIQNYFRRKWDIFTTIGTSDSGTNYIKFNTGNTIKLFKLIGKYILSCFAYKIDMNRKLLWQKLSPKEIAYMKQNYNIESPQLIAHKLSRPLQTIFGTAHRLGVSQPRGGRKFYEKHM
ncbi:MAG: hypothetical protein ACE5GI_06545, partial [Candidatus Aminicenantales bacterium]